MQKVKQIGDSCTIEIGTDFDILYKNQKEFDFSKFE